MTPSLAKRFSRYRRLTVDSGPGRPRWLREEPGMRLVAAGRHRDALASAVSPAPRRAGLLRATLSAAATFEASLRQRKAGLPADRREQDCGAREHAERSQRDRRCERLRAADARGDQRRRAGA